MSAQQVLFDAPGPKARRRNRIIEIASYAVFALVVASILYVFISKGELSAKKWNGVALAWRYLLSGLGNTLLASVLATVAAVVVAVVLTAGRLAEARAVRVVFTAIVEFFQGMPLVLMIFFFYFGFPRLIPALQPLISPLFALVAGLALYNGSVMSEVLRAGLDSLPKGQSEAAYAIGLQKGQALQYVLLPQAIRAMLPSLVAQLIVLVKDTALGYLVLYFELTRAADLIRSTYSLGFPLFPATIVVAVIFIILNEALHHLAGWLEGRQRNITENIETDAIVPTTVADHG